MPAFTSKGQECKVRDFQFEVQKLMRNFPWVERSLFPEDKVLLETVVYHAIIFLARKLKSRRSNLHGMILQEHWQDWGITRWHGSFPVTLVGEQGCGSIGAVKSGKLLIYQMVNSGKRQTKMASESVKNEWNQFYCLEDNNSGYILRPNEVRWLTPEWWIYF